MSSYEGSLGLILQVSMALLFVVTMHFLSIIVSLLWRRPAQVQISQAVVTGTAAGCGFYPLLQSPASAGLIGVVVAGISYWLVHLATSKGIAR